MVPPAMSAGTEAFPTPPDFSPPPPPLPAISRYRSLRGKSTSSPGLPKVSVFDCYFDQCNADCGGANHKSTRNASYNDLPLRDAASSAPTLRSIRRRSKSLSNNTPARLLLMIPSPTGRVVPKPAWRAIGSLGSPSSTSSQFQGPAHHHAPPTPTTPPVGIAHDGSHQGPGVPDLTALAPTASSFKPSSRKIPSTPKTASTFGNNSTQSQGKPDTSRLKALHDFAFNHNNVISRRAARLQRDEADRRQREATNAAHLANEVARLEAETDRILAEQKKRDAARAQAQLAQPLPRPKFLILDKFSFLSRSKRSNAISGQVGQVGTPSPSPTAPTVFSLDSSRSSSLQDPTSPIPQKMSFIEQGGRGIVPQIDAPIAASNGAERRVAVRCLSSTINLPVTPETSPIDILYSTANLTSHNIDPANSVLVECYTELGLERRLRRYERIRDVMNSWDRDPQNSLLVLTCDLAEDNSNLDIASVERTEQNPPGFSLQLYHSALLGKWSKRWITLLESGQILASKKQDAGPHDKDSTILCHLSDFDIYTPRESEVRRHLKAPKRFCYAIKSQQKTFVFPNGENFVHFFCMEHRDMAKRFLETVHGWRSWYLVNKKVDLTKKDEKAMQQVKRAGTVKHGAHESISVVKSRGHRLKVSVDETPYTIGNFQPLLDLGRFDKPLEEFGKGFMEEKAAAPQPEPRPEQKQEPALQRRPTNRSKVLTESQGQAPPLPLALQGEEEFSPAGLLGDRYEEKKRQTERPVPVALKVDGPFTEGPSLLNGGIDSPVSPVGRHEPRPWIPSATEHSIRSRSHSVKAPRRPVPSDSGHSGRPRHPPQPLINLTNNFPEPPRAGAWRDGQGRGVKAPAGNGPLINFATGGAPQDFMRSGNRTPMEYSGGPAPLISGAGPLGQRARSRSSGALQPPNHRFEDAPPVPPLPHRSVRRQDTQPVERSRGRDPRPREPLINRAGTTGAMRY